jgi:outer membrane protein OmpA-like peptidoglycan-associated protein
LFNFNSFNMLTAFPRIVPSSTFLVVMVLLTACATEKEVVRTRPVAAINQPEEPLAEEKTAAAPAPEAEAKAKAKAADGASANKGKEAKRQPAKGKQAAADEGDEYGDDDSDALDNSNIFFQYASHELSPASKRELARVAAILKRNKSARVTLSGHTCDKSSLSVNMRLSQKRAEAASGYLQQLGVSAGRISIEAHGYNQPLAPNTSERNRAKNRRVEVTVEE